MNRLILALEHRVLRDLRAQAQPLPRRWLLAVSGGLDSMVMAEMLWRWRKLLKIELAVAHVHHGSDAGVQAEYRRLAQRAVAAWTKAHGLHFHTLRPRARGLSSEAELRAFRHRTLERWRRAHGYDVIVLAHHRDDLVETRLLRLIRGTGRQGLGAMATRTGVLLRPLLGVSRAELHEYARARGLVWCEDPSNTGEQALRNWLRHKWLPELEKRQKGALRGLARSLELLACSPPSEIRLDRLVGLRRKELAGLERARRHAVLAEFLKALVAQGYGRAHVEEIAKRLATRRANFEFDLLGLRFRVTPDLIWASRV